MAEKSDVVNPNEWLESTLATLLERTALEPQLTMPALRCASRLSLGLERIPPWIVASFEDFIPCELPHVNSYVVSLIVQGWHDIAPEKLDRLTAKLTSSIELLRMALEHDDLPSFPNARDLCIYGLTSTNDATALTHSLLLLSEHWPGELATRTARLVAAAASRHWKVRAASAGALAHAAPGEAARMVRILLFDPVSSVRKQALASHVHLVKEAAAADLLVALQDPSDQVRAEACVHLGKLGDATYLTALLSRASDVAEDVRVEALRAISRIDRDYALRSFGQFAKRSSAFVLVRALDPLTVEERTLLAPYVPAHMYGFPVLEAEKEAGEEPDFGEVHAGGDEDDDEDENATDAPFLDERQLWLFEPPPRAE